MVPVAVFKSSRRSLLFALLLGLWSAGFSSAHAEEAAVIDGSLIQREQMLYDELCAMQRPMRAFTYGWLSGLGAVLAGQTAYVFTIDASDEAGRAMRAGALIGIGMNAIGVALVRASSSVSTRSCVSMSRLREREESLADRIRFGENQLTRADRVSRRQTSVWMHALAVTLGLSVGIGLGLGYDDNAVPAALQGVATFAFTELKVWTRPSAARKAYARYRSRYPVPVRD